MAGSLIYTIHIFCALYFFGGLIIFVQELDGWEPEDDPWTEHASHARGNCAYIKLGKKPHELTVMEVLSVLEPERVRCLMMKMHDNWAEKFNEKCEDKRREIDMCAPK